jgi:purine-nucleoside phosphorylase
MGVTAFSQFESQVRAAKPRAAIVLGSGLGAVVDAFKTFASISFADVPGFAAPTVHGHAGKVLAVEWAGVPVLAFRGRMHYYEGHAWDRCLGTIRLAAAFEIKTILLTNAAGGIHDTLNPGDLMILDRHLALLDPQSWQGIASGIRTVNPYDPDSVNVLKTLAGSYAGLTGPTYETPAEIRALKAMGADAVGMSTVREALEAQRLGMRVAAVSCITNKAAGLSAGTLDHAEVAEVAGRGDVVARMEKLVAGYFNSPALQGA